MNLRSKHLLMVAGLLAGVFAPIAGTAVPDRDWPSVEVTPILDVPMRDTAITRGPDGTYYLTGTLGVSVVGRAAHSPPQAGTNDGALGTVRPTHDFENSRVIKLWKSADLKKWSEVGVVWDIDHHKNAGEWNWQSYWRTPMSSDLPAARARRRGR